MSRRYASGTEVSVEKSKAEIEGLLLRYGAKAFGSAWMPGFALIEFEARDRRIRFILPMPDPKEDRFQFSKDRWGNRSARRPNKATEVWMQSCRQSWRALALVVKAKLEAVEANITTFEDEFLAHIVMPDGRTVAEHVKPKIAIAYQGGDMPPLLSGPSQNSVEERAKGQADS